MVEKGIAITPQVMETPEFTTRSARRIHGSIADWLGMRVVRGEFAVGDNLPGELVFCDQHGVSRTAYREAMRMIASKGLVVSRTRTGTRVAPREQWAFLDPDVVRWFFSCDPPPSRFIRDLYELRMFVEPQAAATAAERRTEADLAEIASALNRMGTARMTEAAWREADAAFHRSILRATGNEVLLSLASGICAAVAYTTEYKYRSLRHPRNPIEEHRAVFERIRDGDAEGARRLMQGLVGIALQETSATLTG